MVRNRSSMTQGLAGTLLIAGLLLLIPNAGETESASLEGSWSGGGSASFASGGTERARCRAHYSRRSNDRYVVRAICATASTRVEQTVTLRKIAENKYAGSFYNDEYGASGTVSVTVQGNTQSVRLTSSAGWASLKFSR